MVRAAVALGLTLYVGVSALSAFAADWPQTRSDVKADPAVTFGKLPNGMLYAVMSNNTPHEALSLRLRIDAGSLQESEAQQGIAHLLEHMAFRGSKEIPDGEVVKSLQRLGLRFGADTNAFTAQTQTVYKYDLPRSDAAGLDTALKLLREVGDALTITDEALATERGVVLSEWRLHDVPRVHAQDARFAAMFPDQRVSQRFPLGKRDVLEKAGSSLIRSFYETYYRPERASLIVVGNVDAKEVEKKIVDVFSDWASSGPPVQDPDFGPVKGQGVTGRTYFEKSLPTVISANWLKPYRNEVETLEFDKQTVISSIGMQVFNQRLLQAGLSAEAPFTSAQVGQSYNVSRSGEWASIDINTTPEKWRSAGAAGCRLLTEALTQGLSQVEVDRAIADFRARLQNQLMTAGSRDTRDLANRLVNTVDGNQVFESPQGYAENAERVLTGLNAEAVTSALRQTFGGSGPVVFMTSNEPITGADDELSRIFSGDCTEGNSPLISSPILGNLTWPYTNFGEPATVLSTLRAEAVDATFVRFSNGVQLAVKPTKFHANEVYVIVKMDGGRRALPRDKPHAAAMLYAFVSGGLEAIDYPTIQKALAGKTVRVNAILPDAHLWLNGSTTTRDLEAELQMLAAYVSSPAFRESGFEQFRQLLRGQIPSLEAQPVDNLRRRASYLLRANDPRWAPPSVEDVDIAKIDDLKSWLIPMLKETPLQVAIVGDVTVESAVALTARTFGALPARPSLTEKRTRYVKVDFPPATPSPIIARHQGSKDKAAVMIAWPVTNNNRGLDEAAEIEMLRAVFEQRLTEEVRNKLGAGYSPHVYSEGSWEQPGFGALVAVADTKPDQAQLVLDLIESLAAQLSYKPVAADEFDRALKPAVAAAQTSSQNNMFLANHLTAPDIDPKPTAFAAGHVALLQAVTAERVQKLAHTYLVGTKAWKEVMIPE